MYVAKYRKSLFGSTAIVVSVAMYLFVIVVVLVFFHVFKFQITKTILDLYNWNKVQEIPLDLLSVDIDDESLVSRVNKVYHGKLDENELKDWMDETISKQLFYFFGETKYPLTTVIHVGDIEITKYLKGCGCYISDGNIWETYTCTAECPRAGEVCWKETIATMGQKPTAKDHNWCMDVDKVTELQYSAKFPFPLTFDGTDKLVDELSYEIIEGR